MNAEEISIKIGTKTYPLRLLFSRKLWVSILLMMTTLFWFTFCKNDLLAFWENKKLEHIILTQPQFGKPAHTPRNMYFKINGHKISCSITNENGTTFCEQTHDLHTIEKIDQAEGILLSYSNKVETKPKFLLSHLIYKDKNGVQHEFTTSQSSLSKTERYFDGNRIFLAYYFIASYIGLILYAAQDWIKNLYSSS